MKVADAGGRLHKSPSAREAAERIADGWHSELEETRKRNAVLGRENAKLRELLSSALIVAGFKGRQYLDTYLTEEEGTTLWQELKGLGIEVEG